MIHGNPPVLLNLPNSPNLPKSQNKVFDDVVYLELMNNLNKLSNCLEEFGVEDILNLHVSMNKFLHDSEKMREFRSIF